MDLLTLALDLLDDTPARRVRHAQDPAIIEDYRKARVAQKADPGLKPFDALRVCLDATGKHWLWDGGHRLRAFLAAGDTEYMCEVEPGEFSDALAKARHDANATHGLRRSNEDKRAIARDICSEELDRRAAGQPATPSRDLGALAGGTREHPAISHTFINKTLADLTGERRKAAAEKAEDAAVIETIRALAPLALALGFARLRASFSAEPADLSSPIDDILAALPHRWDRKALADRLIIIAARDPRRDPRPHDVLRLVAGSVAILLAPTTTWTPEVRLLHVDGTEHHHRLNAEEYRALMGGAEVIQAAHPQPNVLDPTKDPDWTVPEGGHDWLNGAPPVHLLPPNWASKESCPTPSAFSSIPTTQHDSSTSEQASQRARTSTISPATAPSSTASTSLQPEGPSRAQLVDRVVDACERLLRQGVTTILHDEGQGITSCSVAGILDTAGGHKETVESLTAVLASLQAASAIAATKGRAVRIVEVDAALARADQDDAEAIERVAADGRSRHWAEAVAHQETRRERDALHDRIEGALAAALGNPPMGIHDGDGPVAPTLESLIALVAGEHASVARIQAECDRYASTLATRLHEPHAPEECSSCRTPTGRREETGAVIYALCWRCAVEGRDEALSHASAQRDMAERDLAEARADLAEAIERASTRESELLDQLAAARDERDAKCSEVERLRTYIARLQDRHLGNHTETPCTTPPVLPSPSPCSSASPISGSPSSPSPSAEDASPPSPSTTDAAPAAADPSPAASPSSATAATPTTERPPMAWDHLLGTMPDHEVCTHYIALTPSIVGRRRRKLKIAAYSPPRNVSASAAWAHLLGWTGSAEDLTVAVEGLGDESFTGLYKAITGCAPKARTAKTTEAARKAILRGWKVTS